MSGVLLDTHTWVWSLFGDDHLSDRATYAIKSADAIFVSPVSFFEVAQKVRLGKWPEMETFVGRLPELMREQGASVAAIDPGVCLLAGLLKWPHRDPFDRLLAATAMRQGLPLVSVDTIFDGVITRIW